MKSGRLFWGTLFLAVGLLLLLDKLNVFFLHWHSMWRLWPLTLVFLGTAVLIKNRLLKAVAVVLSALALGLVVYGLISLAWLYEGRHWRDAPYVQELIEPYDSTFQRASLVMDVVAGSYTVENSGDALIAAYTRSDLGEYRLERGRFSGIDELSLTFDGRRSGWPGGKFRNHVNLHLNSNPIWDLDFDVGAARVDADLSYHKTESIKIDAGAASMKLKLGANVDESRVNIDAGASSIRISVPSTAGCEIHYDGGLSGKRFDEFEKVDSDTYRSENFAWSPRKIYIDINVGVSSVRVNRY